MALLAWGASACSMAPLYERPAAPIATHWSDGTPVAPAPQQAPVVPLHWRGFVTDPGLAHCVAQALANNRSLRQTVLDVEAARAQYRIERATRVPQVQLDATGSRQRTPGQPGVQASYEAGVGLAAFELDLFGRVRSLSDAARHDYLASREVADSARVSLVADVISAYLQRDGAQHRYLLGVQVLEARDASLRLVAQRRSAGLASELDYLDALGLQQQGQADLERIDREFRQASNALALLMGTADAQAQLPALPSTEALLVQDIRPGLPSSLLEQRPDIRAAEQRLQARNASIGAARAAFFPRIALTAAAGTRSSELSGLFGSGSRTWAFSPQITLPLFDAGTNRANLDLAWVRRDTAVAAYEQAVQGAFRDVSDALAAGDTLRREEQASAEAARAGTEALRLASLRYRSGIDDGLRYLDAQRTDYSNRMALAQVRTERQLALVALFRSLGGGWEASAP
ncbi:efflux transporter outer membrane subunit [Stenotrophomonas sp. 24(2023)]|uniref:efflux transporter outer membrane subunit n=1 Tax=Stenotrophomonas sp. 24(2023) TaxID=3068324 RepID=UPI0027DEDA06|nr:efflux transporter outer membrane subunit [Stenotrophomonas sp. 24(2023)]WMJ68216.1 efflux transporter outer membrane subunit [Stenotrophomonas sp. 24(2023)]